MLKEQKLRKLNKSCIDPHSGFNNCILTSMYLVSWILDHYCFVYTSHIPAVPVCLLFFSMSSGSGRESSFLLCLALHLLHN